MDTSEIYIKMSDCDEIQSHRKPKIEKLNDGRWQYEWELETGDYFATKDLYEKEERQIEIKGTTIYDPYFYDKSPNANITISQIGYDEGEGYPSKKITWLPRQDQIQEMIDIEFPYACIINQFYPFIKKLTMLKHYCIQEYSMEQLWLAFYMDVRHKKIWNGEKWVGK